MSVSLTAELESRFNFLNQDSNYSVATYLDPRFITNILGVIEAERSRYSILLGFIKMSCEEASSSSSCSSPVKKSRREESAVSREGHDIFWDCFNEVATENDTSQCHDEGKNVIACEIDSYLNTVRMVANVILIFGGQLKQYNAQT
ncbi:hypothetical protein EVAR_6868_1 [Eumeta japonica]|uniref:Uncharacterized protein n=1 Tax=Eumeta variegata TaxID=151549 RepID=A0A4C1TH99_EUMVA|nr:hypothetical protein EVAR_6868_1 [Eumeta japonica]